jgi:ADP-ribose pyrophosphatase
MTATARDKIHFDGRYLGIRERDTWEFATRTNASGVAVLVPLTDDGELVLVEQFRIPVQSQVIELPAGLVGDLEDAGEAVQTAALRELEEETGYRAGRLTTLLTCPSSAGMSDEMVTIFLADKLVRTGAGGGDESEAIIVHLVPLNGAGAWLGDMMKLGKQLDPKIYAGLYWLERHQAGLDPMPV